MNRLTLLTVATSLVLVACAGPAQAGTLEGRTFVSTAVTDGGAPRPLVAGTQVRLTFGADGQLGASAGCNHIGATYRVDGDVLRAEPGAMTEMGCDDARHAQDDWLVQFLASDPRVALAGSDLVLRSGSVQIALVDREVAEPDQPLQGTLWTVDSLIDGDAVSSIPEGGRATLQIDADGSVAVDTGCNELSARATVDGDQIRFSDLVTTDRACLDAGVAALERSVLGVLGADSVRWTIDAGRLTLDAGAHGLTLQAG